MPKVFQLLMVLIIFNAPAINGWYLYGKYSMINCYHLNNLCLHFTIIIPYKDLGSRDIFGIQKVIPAVLLREKPSYDQIFIIRKDRSIHDQYSTNTNRRTTYINANITLSKHLQNT